MSSTRAWILIAMLAAGAVAVLARSVQITVVEHQHWARIASNQQQRVLTVPSRRGEIRSADGYVFATSVDRLAIQVDTHLLRKGRGGALGNARGGCRKKHRETFLEAGPPGQDAHDNELHEIIRTVFFPDHGISRADIGIISVRLVGFAIQVLLMHQHSGGQSGFPGPGFVSYKNLFDVVGHNLPPFFPRLGSIC